MTERLTVADKQNKIILIERSVYFYPEQNLLTSFHGEDSVKLLSTASECLTILINRQGDIVPKGEFIESVWGQKGVIATEHTFYQTILTVRKGFSKLGLENIIKTRYRRGLLIESAVSIIKGEMVVSGELSHYELQKKDSNLFEEDVQVSVENISSSKRVQNIWVTTVLWVFIGVISGGLTGTVIKLPSGGYFDRYHQLTNMESKCQIMVAGSNHLPDKVQSFFRKKNIECTHGEKIYYSARYPVGTHSVIKCDKKFQENKECVTDFYLDSVQGK